MPAHCEAGCFCYHPPHMIHENLSKSIDNLEARIIAIRDSL